MTDRQMLAQEIGKRLKDRAVRIRTLERQNRKLQERLNRISNAMIGNARIWVLDRLVMALKVEADVIEQRIPNLPTAIVGRATEQARMLRVDALYLERLEYDLGTLHVAVKGDTNRRGGRYDQANWKGQRP